MQFTHNLEKKYEYSITHWFQPIYEVKDKIILGYEALLRDASLLNTTPEDIFREADRKGHLNTLDLFSIQNAIEQFKDRSVPLFLNIFPSTILDENFLSWWDSNIPNDRNIVLELLENERIDDWEEIKRVTKELQTRGVKIAIDDMGQGYSFLQQWVELEPDYIKLDRYFAENLSANLRKQKIVGNLVELLSDTTEIIIEGIECEKDLCIAEDLGVSYAQGFFLGRPTPIDNCE